MKVGRPVLLALLLGLTGCLRLIAPQGSFSVTMDSRVQWDGVAGYDAALSGYHFKGGIGAVTLDPLGRTARKMVLEIRTSPGQPPKLEGFVVETPALILQTASAEQVDTVEYKPAKGGAMYSKGWKRDYFDFQCTEKTVRVTFKPGVLQLMRGRCRISWVDWYR